MPVAESLPSPERGRRAGPARTLLLTVGPEVCAVALEDVRVVLEGPAVTRVPGAPPAVLGVTNVRGEVVPVLDTGIALGPAPVGAAPFAAVVDTPAGPVAAASGSRPRSVVRGEGQAVRLLDLAALGRAAGG